MQRTQGLIKQSRKTKWKKSRLALMALTVVLTLTSCSPKNADEGKAVLPKHDTIEDTLNNALHEMEHVHEEEKENDTHEEVVEETKEESIFDQIDLSGYFGNSIEKALEKAGFPSDYNFRSELAAHLGIENYTGTAEQNLLMLALLGANDFMYDGKTYKVTYEENNKVENTTNNTHENTHENSTSNGGTNNGSGSATEDNKHEKCNFGAWMALDENSEQRICPDCGKKETRSHTLSPEVTIRYVYDSENPDHHIVIKEQKCTTCNYHKSTKTQENCHYEDYQYNEDTKLDERTCKDCGHIDTKKVDCEHELSKWHSISDTEEQRECSKCHKIYKKLHKFSKWLFKDKNSHQKECDSCGHVVTLNHTLTKWTAKDDVKDERHCPDCGYIEEKNHNFNPWMEGDESTHQKDCGDCGHIVKEKHDYSEWIAKDDDKEERDCLECGRKEEKSHTYELLSTTYENIKGDDQHHIKVEIYICRSPKCAHKKVVRTTVACEFENEWTYKDGLDIKNCIADNCENKLERNHEHWYDKSPNRVDNQNEYYNCGGCNKEHSTAHDYGNDDICDNCGHVREVAHIHPGTTKVKDTAFVSNGTQCEHYVITCTDPSCPDPHVGDEYLEHTNWRNPETVGSRGDVKKTCDDCFYYVIIDKNGNIKSEGHEQDSVSLLSEYAYYHDLRKEEATEKVEDKIVEEVSEEQTETETIDKEESAVKQEEAETIVKQEETVVKQEEIVVKQEETETMNVELQENNDEEINLEEIQAALDAYLEEVMAPVPTAEEEEQEKAAVLGLTNTTN